MKAFDPVVLAGKHIRLEPLHPGHVAGLAAAAAENRDSFGWTPVPNGEAEFRARVASDIEMRAAGERLAFATIDATRDLVVGSTSFLDPQRWPGPVRDREFHSIEIGATWLAASAQRTFVNTEAKLLMLVHAFDSFGVLRVVLNTDARNERSRAAIARLGATFEGIMHGYRFGVEGTPRDTATFAITVRDWPEVRTRLEARLKPE